MGDDAVELVAAVDGITQLLVLPLNDLSCGNELYLRAHAFEEDVFLERLADVVGGSGLEAFEHGLCVVQCRKEDDGDVLCLGLSLEDLTDLEAGELRHHHVEQDEVGHLVFHKVHDLERFSASDDFIATAREHNLEQHYIGGHVIYDKYLEVRRVYLEKFVVCHIGGGHGLWP